MKNKISLFVISLHAIFLTSCLDGEKKVYFEEIDRMMLTLDSLESAYKLMPNDSFSIVKKDALAIEKEVKTYFMEDTVDHAFAKKMNRLRGIRKGSDFIAMRRKFLDTIFTFQREQLVVLKEDITNGAGKRDEYQKYVNQEKENMSIIASSHKDYKLRFDSMRSEYYDIAQIIRDRVRPFKEKATKP
jgi:hypothetical protein